MSTEALARALVASARDQEYASFSGAPMARAIVADPGPLLAALAEAGVLTEEHGATVRAGDGPWVRQVRYRSGVVAVEVQP